MKFNIKKQVNSIIEFIKKYYIDNKGAVIDISSIAEFINKEKVAVAAYLLDNKYVAKVLLLPTSNY